MAQYINIEKIKYHPLNEMIYGKKESVAMEELMQNIAEYGILQPIILDQNNYVISGNRRLYAAEKLNMISIPFERKEFRSETDKILALLNYNAYRAKSKLVMIEEAHYNQLIRKYILSHGNENLNDIIDFLAKIKNQDITKNVSKKEISEATGLSPRSIQTARKVSKAVKELKESGQEQKAEKISQKAKKSLAGALKMVDNEKAPKENLTSRHIRTITSVMESQIKKIEKEIKSTTPKAVVRMFSEFKIMYDRIASWLPENMQDCPRCEGKGYVETNHQLLDESKGTKTEICRNCISGKVGIYKDD